MDFILIHVNGVGRVLSSLPAVYCVFIDKKIRTLLFANTLPFASQRYPGCQSAPRRGKVTSSTISYTDHCFCQILSCACERRQSRRHSGEEKKTTSRCCPASVSKANPESGDAIRLRGQGLALGYDSWRELGCEVFLRMDTEQHIRGGSGISEPILWRLFRNKRNWLQLCLITVPCGAHTLVASTECEPAL